MAPGVGAMTGAYPGPSFVLSKPWRPQEMLQKEGAALAVAVAPARLPTLVKTTDAGTSRDWAAGLTLAAIAVCTKQRRKHHRFHPSGALRVHQRASASARAAGPKGGYCEAVEKCVRRPTRTVYVGDVPVGSENRVAVQTMTTTRTDDVEATVAQVKKCADAGIDIVRITVQGMKEAKACEHIKRRLLEDGYTTPLVADIHFTPKVALAVADHVDKVRVNPGNFADGRKSFDTLTELTDDDVSEAREAIEAALVPLVLKLKEKNKAMRIGVNHGSLSERILFQYGDSPEGMVASAVEFGEICRKHDYHNFIFSMKSSNPQVMVAAYRQLAKEMYKLGWDYPMHLGVTEAGGGADGRIKSAVGIGALLLDGLGDTIRVSLTEDPEYEAAPCKALRTAAENAIGTGVEEFEESGSRREGRFSRRKCDFPLDVPLNADGSVLAHATVQELETLDIPGLCERFGLRFRADGDVQKDWKSNDAVLIEGDIAPTLVDKLKVLLDVPMGILCKAGPNVPDGCTLLYDASAEEPLEARLGGYALVMSGKESSEEIKRAVELGQPRLILFKPVDEYGITFSGRRFFSMLNSIKLAASIPVMLWFRYPAKPDEDEDAVVVRASSDFGSLFVDGLGEGILWDADVMNSDLLRESSFNLLQAARMRISKTEFISCPSCGRTLFNLQDTTKKIQDVVGHLPGVRVAIMGCIVNGPGEMADADFGYVGSGVGKIDLYVGYDCVKRAIPSEDAVDKLIDLIKENGKWQDPPEEVEADSVEAVAMAM